MQNAHVRAQKDFSGDLNLELVTTVTDGSDSNEQTDRIQVTFNPVTDTPVLQLTDVFATEDTPTKFDIFPQTTDVDGSEIVTKMELSSIPKNVTFSIGENGQSITTTSDNESITLNVIESGTSNLANNTITKADLKNLHITAPKDSNETFNVNVTPTVKDGNASVETIAPQQVTVFVKGDADTPVRTDGTTGATSVDADEFQSADGGLVDIHELGFKTGETVNPADKSETLTYVLKNLPKEFLPTDADGNTIGDFISTNGNTVNWSLTQDQMNELHIKVPQYHSGTTALTLEAIAVENDGDTATASRNFNLVIDPVISTADPVQHEYNAKEPVTLHPDNNANPTYQDTRVALNFSNTIDSETVTKVEIGTVPDGVKLGIQNGDTFTEATPNGSGIYTFDSDIDKIVAVIKADGNFGNTTTTPTNNITLGGIKVWMKDAGDDSSVTAAETGANGLAVNDIIIHMEGQADQPYISAVNVTAPSGGNVYNDISVTTTFPDNDNSEAHYYIIKTEDNVLLNKGIYQGNGEWYLTEAEAASFHAEFDGTGEKNLVVTAYSAEGTLQQNSKTVQIIGADGAGTGTNTLAAQEPILEVTNPQTNEDNPFTLADVVVGADTGNQDDGNGNETLSFVIKGLDDLAASHIKSIEGVTQYSYEDDQGNTKTAYRVDIAGIEPDENAIEAALANVKIHPEDNYSGNITFTLEAVANEPGAPMGSRFASTSEEVTVTVQPVAENSLSASAAGDLANPINENTGANTAITQVKLNLSNEDTSNPETFSNIALSLDADKGEFVKADGTGLGTSLTGLSYNPATGVITDGSGTEIIYYQPKQYASGEVTIHITADMTDGSNTTQGAVADITINIAPVPSSGDFTLTDGSGNTVSTTDKLGVNEDGTVKLDIHSDFHDDDHSEFQTILIKDVPPGMLFYNSDGDLVGEINAVGNDGKSIWKLPAGSAQDGGVMNGNLFIKPPLHYTEDITLKVVGVAMEQDNMGTQISHEKFFTLDITPIANGATIFPQNASGEANTPFAVDLQAELVALNEVKTVGLVDDSGEPLFAINEIYNLTFTNVPTDITLYYKDGGNELHPKIYIDKGDSGTVSLTQAEIDGLHMQLRNSETGGFAFDIKVTTTDGNSTVSDADAATGTLNVNVGPAASVHTVIIDGKTTIFGSSQDDTVNAAADSDNIYGGEGNDNLNGGQGDDAISGGVGNDTLDGGVGNDQLWGDGGNDTLNGGQGDDTMYAGEGDDTLNGGEGKDKLNGQDGDDILDGGAGSDELWADAGNDTLIFDPADTKIHGGDGQDTLKVTDSNVDFTTLANELILDMEVIDLTGSGSQAIKLDKAHVKSMAGVASNTLLVNGDTGADTVNLENGWTTSGTDVIDGITYRILDNGDAHLKIQDGVNYNIA